MRGYSVVALDHPKTSINVGSVLRLATNFNVRMIVQSGRRYERAPTDTFKSSRHLPLLVVNNIFDAIPFDCIPIAVELIERGRSIHNFVHPQSAYYIFGPEDGTLGKKTLDRCAHTIYIPTNRCMNLAVTVGIVLYDRQHKEQTYGPNN